MIRSLLMGVVLLTVTAVRVQSAATPGEYFSDATLSVTQISFGALAALGDQPIDIVVRGNKMRWTTSGSLMEILMDKIGGGTGFLPAGPHTSIYDGDQPEDKRLTYLVNNHSARDSISSESGSVYTQGKRPFGYGGPLFGMIMGWGEMIYTGSRISNDGTFWHPKIRWHHYYTFFGVDPVDVGFLTCEAPLFKPWDIYPVSYVSSTTTTYFSFNDASHGTAQDGDFQPPPGAQPLIARPDADGQPFGANVSPGAASD